MLLIYYSGMFLEELKKTKTNLMLTDYAAKIRWRTSRI
jgi:hypothetical protein